MIKIGVIGAGHLGKIHIKLLKEIDKFELVGFYDANAEAAIVVEKEFGIKRFETLEGQLLLDLICNAVGAVKLRGVAQDQPGMGLPSPGGTLACLTKHFHERLLRGKSLDFGVVDRG